MVHMFQRTLAGKRSGHGKRIVLRKDRLSLRRCNLSQALRSENKTNKHYCSHLKGIPLRGSDKRSGIGSVHRTMTRTLKGYTKTVVVEDAQERDIIDVRH